MVAEGSATGRSPSTTGPSFRASGDAQTPSRAGSAGAAGAGSSGAAPTGPSAEHPWPVSMLGQKLREYIDRLGSVWVEGEITQWGVSGGNV